MNKSRKTYASDFKVKVALAAIKGLQTTNQIATLYGAHPNQVAQWKKQALTGLPDTVSCRRARQAQDQGGIDRPTLSADRATQSRVGLAQKKSRIIQLIKSAC